MSLKNASRLLSPKDLLMLCALTVVWGVNWPIMKIGIRDFPALSFRVLCMVGGLAYLFVFLKARGQSLKVERRYWKELLAIGFFNMVVWYICAIYGVKLLSSGRAAILGYTLPIWTALIGFLVFRENPGARMWAGVASAAAGVALLLSNEFGGMAGRPLGVLLMLTAAACWGYGTHLMRRRSQEVPTMVLMFWTLTLSLICCGMVSLLIERDQWVRLPNAAEWFAIAYNAILVFGFAQIAWYRLATLLPPVASGLSVMLIPVLGVFSAEWLIDERPQWQDYAALVCILIAIATVVLPNRWFSKGAPTKKPG